jgi:polyphosphate kinase
MTDFPNDTNASNDADASQLIALTPETYINRELSTIEFQRRVLAIAQDSNVPLLERAKFIAIVGNNLDEFFMVRVASYIQKAQLGISRTRPDGYTPQQLLKRIRTDVGELFEHIRITKAEVLMALEQENIHILPREKWSDQMAHALEAYFIDQVFPVLTPLAVDHARPFPFISNLSLNLGVILQRDEPESTQFARIKVPVPDILKRLINLNQVMEQYAGVELDGYYFAWVEDVILENLVHLFPGMDILEACPFRVVRNADIDYEFELDEDGSNDVRDVMSIIEKSVRERRFGSVVRLSVPEHISERMLERLREGLEIDSDAMVYTIKGALGSANLFELASVDRPDLKYEPYVPKFPEPILPETDIFASIRAQDILMHHPYDSFTPVETFFKAAASDPQVLAIKATLYRVGKNSPIVQALMDARENDKQVTVLVELKARFDEENNLEWARALEAKGVHVIYGVEELPVKTHAKIALVVRREGARVRRYLHLGTGNYNASTARLYTDLGLFTCNSQLANDASRLFNRLSGFAPQTTYERLLVAPDYLLGTFLDLIDNEIEAARQGHDARLIFKMNQLEEDLIIQRLYAASQAGVKVYCNVRGFCSLRPGVPEISENITVDSLIGRFLEHSRIYYFKNAPEHMRLYVGSADIMRRNLYNRVEVVFPILDTRIRQRILRVLATNMLDNTNTWRLKPDGTYMHRQPQSQDRIVNAQKTFMQRSYGLDILPE